MTEVQRADDLLADTWGEDLPGVEGYGEEEPPKKRKRGGKRRAPTNGGAKKKKKQPPQEEEEEEESASASSESSEEEEEEEEREVDAYRYLFADPSQTINEDLGKLSRVYHTGQDQRNGFGMSRGNEVPLVDAHGAVSYAKGGGAFIKTSSISKQMKNRAGIESMATDASQRVARYGEDCVAAVVSQAIVFCKARGQKTVTPEDVQQAASLMGIDNLVRC